VYPFLNKLHSLILNNKATTCIQE